MNTFTDLKLNPQGGGGGLKSQKHVKIQKEILCRTRAKHCILK